MDVKFPNSSGMVPESRLLYRCKRVKFLREPKVLGTKPERLFVSRLKNMREFRFPISKRWSQRAGFGSYATKLAFQILQYCKGWDL